MYNDRDDDYFQSAAGDTTVDQESSYMAERLDTSQAVYKQQGSHERIRSAAQLSRLYTTAGSIDFSVNNTLDLSKAHLLKEREELEPPSGTQADYNWTTVTCLTAIGTLSGLCFGYDTAVISGAALYFGDTFPGITHGQQEMVVSFAVLGAALGALTTGHIADTYGRKFTILLGDLLMTVGTLLMCFAPSLTLLTLGRLIAGLGFGTECMACSVYLAEVAPRKLRGAIVTANIACCVFGQLLALIVCICLAPNWRAMLGCGAIPAVLQGLLTLAFMPETPYFLMRANREEEAAEVVALFFRSPAAARDETSFIQRSFDEDVNAKKRISFGQAFKEIVKFYPNNLVVGCLIQACQQLCGINTVMYYGPFILRDAGFGSEGARALLINTLPLSAVSFLGGLISIFVSERWGRRSSMRLVLPFIAVSMVALSFAMLCTYHLGLAQVGAYTAMCSLFLFLFSFQLGMSGQPWTVCSEIFPTHLRGVSNSLTTFSNFFFNYVVAAVFLSATSSEIGKVLSYLVIAAFAIGTLIFVQRKVPETKGKPLAECVQLFMTHEQISAQRNAHILASVKVAAY